MSSLALQVSVDPHNDLEPQIDTVGVKFARRIKMNIARGVYCIFSQNRIFFLHPLFLENVNFSPKYSEYFPFFHDYPTLLPYIYLRFSLLNHLIFSPANQYFIFLQQNEKYAPLIRIYLNILYAQMNYKMFCKGPKRVIYIVG